MLQGELDWDPIDHEPAGRATGSAGAGIRVLPPPAEGSLKLLPARLEYMHSHYLGKHVPVSFGGPGNQAKRAVMLEACGLRGRTPTFSRMSGIQEWENAIFLFVNFGEEDFGNELLDGGRQITWYAQNRQTIASAQILRMIHHKKGHMFAIGGKDNEADTVFLEPCSIALICRRGADPYVWCGELTYVSHDVTVHPIKFVWSLNHYSKLVDEPTSLFHSFLARGGVPK